MSYGQNKSFQDAIDESNLNKFNPLCILNNLGF